MEAAMQRGRAPLVLVLVTAVALAAGCGSSSSSPSTSGASTPSASTPSTPSTSTGGSLSGGDSFCGQGKADLKQLKAQLALAANISSTPERLKAQLQTIMAAYQKAEGEAPSQIKGDIAAISSTMSELNQILAAHGYNLMASAAQAAPLFNSPQFKAAGKHLQAWAKANCGA
jgi:hypothetical protein